jgi:hypothetical protein
MINEGDISSISYKRSLRGSKSMNKVDGLSLMFIDFCVPALTPRLSSSEISLQLSEKRVFFIRYCIATAVLVHFDVSVQPRGYMPQEYSFYLCLLTTLRTKCHIEFCTKNSDFIIGKIWDHLQSQSQSHIATDGQ